MFLELQSEVVILMSVRFHSPTALEHVLVDKHATTFVSCDVEVSVENFSRKRRGRLLERNDGFRLCPWRQHSRLRRCQRSSPRAVGLFGPFPDTAPSPHMA